MEINDSLLDFWLEHSYNAQLRGRRGTGKTTMITAAFTRKFGDKWKYFSAPTMDPWVDFVGVPEKVISEKGNACLELIRPREFADDEVYALFFDELNRAKPKVIDAVMELIQFKSINGRKFKNLKVVWCATNPKVHDGDEDEEYNVEELDAAHTDRFHIFVETEYKCNEEFFQNKFPALADAAISWWNKLPDKAKNKVSPRRLEYALDVFEKGGDIAYVLPKEANHSALVTQLRTGSFTKRLGELYKNNNPAEIKKALLNENFFNGVKDEISNKPEYLTVFAPLFPNEKFNSFITTDAKFKNFVLSDTAIMKAGLDNLMNIIEANKANPRIVKEIKEKLAAAKLFVQKPLNIVVDKHYEELAKDFFADEQRKMRICGFLQNQDLSAFSEQDLTKATVIVLTVVANTPVAVPWLSCKIALQQIKNEAAKQNITFRRLFNNAKADQQYMKYVSSETKIDSLIQDAGLFDEDSSITKTAGKAAANYITGLEPE